MVRPKDKTRVTSRRVWTTLWDTGGMAGGGSACVYERGGRFHVRSTDFEPAGPYRTLLAALKKYGLHRPQPGVGEEITSAVLSAEEMAGMLDGSDLTAGEDAVTLDGEVWEWAAPGVFRRAEEDDEE